MVAFNSNMEPNKKGQKYKGIKAGNTRPVVSTLSGSSLPPPGAQVSQCFGTIMAAWGSPVSTPPVLSVPLETLPQVPLLVGVE